MPPAAETPPRAQAVRHFGRFQLLGLAGKSECTMAWRVADPQRTQELLLVLPRVQPPDGPALESWNQGLRRASRLAHPNLAPVVEVGLQDGWPYAAYDPGDAATLAEKMSVQGMPGLELATLSLELLQGLAFAHEAGIAHRDLQPYLVLLSAQGVPQIVGFEVAPEASGTAPLAFDHGGLRAQRDAAQRDLLTFGVLLHHALLGRPALDQPDTGRVVRSLPPSGRDVVRLPYGTVQIPEPLRAIINRATDRHERHRYRNARTLVHALEGWLKTGSASGHGPLALLLDRLARVGLLPASPGAAVRVGSLAGMDRKRTSELAAVVLKDIALSFELLRVVNSAQLRASALGGSGPVLTVRRAIAMIGTDGVRQAAQALRPWPGPLPEAAALMLEQQLARAERAGQLALRLRPPGYDTEVVFLVTLLQTLGRLVVQYHFPDDALQIRRLMQPAAAERPGEADDPGMSEEAASFAVLGTDIEALGLAVARHLGLDDAVLAMIRRVPLDRPVRVAESEDELLRMLASCAHEALDALDLPSAQHGPALARIANRYARALDLDGRRLHHALQSAPEPVAVADSALAPL